jgi:amino-acid N-acetyltransferase
MMIQISPRWKSIGSGRVAAQSGASDAAPTTAPVPTDHVVVRAATISDMRAVEPLIREFAEYNLMLPKSFDQLVRNFREFVVATDPDGRIVGCGALRVYGESLAEVCSLAVESSMQRSGLGRRLVERLVENAQDLAISRVFALTLNPQFFGRLGFEVVAKDEFPQKVWADCRSCPKLHACDEIAVAMDV